MRYLASLILIVLMFSCAKETKEKEFRTFNFQNQEWKSKVKVQLLNDISYQATEVPLQYYISKSLEGKNDEMVDSIYQGVKDERVVEIEFQHIEQKDLLQQEFTSRDYTKSVEYMAFKIQNDFKVVTSSGDTIVCSGVNFERNFKVAPFKRLILHFGGISPNDQIKLIYQDNLFGNGILKFNFSESPIKL